jgi:hypothetical protein
MYRLRGDGFCRQHPIPSETSKLAALAFLFAHHFLDGTTANSLALFHYPTIPVPPFLEVRFLALATLAITMFFINEELVLLELATGTTEAFICHRNVRSRCRHNRDVRHTPLVILP